MKLLFSFFFFIPLNMFVSYNSLEIIYLNYNYVIFFTLYANCTNELILCKYRNYVII